MAGAMACEEGHYAVLEVPFDASAEDIRQSYHKLARMVHPDRSRPGSAVDRFHQVQLAWRCLSDPTRRLLYDLRTEGKSSLSTDCEEKLRTKLDVMQKEQAAIDVRNMQDALTRIKRREQVKGGILIKKALYGDLRLREDHMRLEIGAGTTIEESDLQGPFIDVAEPVQFLVEQHTICINGGNQTSKADLQGFYNPAPLDNELELELYVLYEFKGKLHEVIAGDRETLSLPRRAHMVPDQQIRGPYSQANVSYMMACRAMQEDPRSARNAASSQRGGSTFSSRKAVSMSPQKVLERAVIAYRLAALRDRCAESASPREFAVVALCSGVTVALIAVWARWGAKR